MTPLEMIEEFGKDAARRHADCRPAIDAVANPVLFWRIVARTDARVERRDGCEYIEMITAVGLRRLYSDPDVPTYSGLINFERGPAMGPYR